MLSDIFTVIDRYISLINDQSKVLFVARGKTTTCWQHTF